MIKISNLTKTYGIQTLFDNTGFAMNARERVGLVGRNGHGKSTLFKIILGQEETDSGDIVVPKHYSIGHLEQHIRFTQPTVLEEACMGLPADQQHDSWRVEKVLFGLGFTESDMDRPPSEFSGGFQVRLNLAKVLASAPDLLLLDEPTNYLDIVSIRWLIKFLNAWKGELMLITHDRSFMDAVITHTLGIHRQKMRKLEGTTDKYYAQIMHDEEIYEKTRVNEDKKRKEVELFITRFRAKARLAGLVQSRVKTLAKQEKMEKLEKIENLDFEFHSEEFPAKVMLETRDLTFSYTGHEPYLLENLNLTIGRNDRIAIIGKNGKGKSTFLRLLVQELNPVHGSVKQHPKLDIAYYGQTNIDRLDATRTIEEEVGSADQTAGRQRIRDICGAVMFSGDMALKKINVLSGGERARVLLAKLLLYPAHLLLLDEPTHHLDMESCEALMNAIEIFDGSVLLVTHDEMMLHALANKFVVFDQDRVFTYTGSYQDFLNEIGWDLDENGKRDLAIRNQIVIRAPHTDDEDESPAVPEKSEKKDKEQQRKLKAVLIQEKSRVLKPLETAVRELEKSIEGLEASLARNNQSLVTAAETGDVAAMTELPKQKKDLEQQLGFLYGKLETATKERETKTAEFEKKLKALDTEDV
ncbi:MAG: ATP-binding cassette domain-containing protein [Candidatus Firestonebacteria bacterium]|nr:ATP-binding cassette domain-containing protein [Candidatus Firestonebacteria bacterium]